jgi:hypothetical protein
MTHLTGDAGLVSTQRADQLRIGHHTGLANALAPPQFIPQPV